MKITNGISNKLDELEKKYSDELESYLDGLIHYKGLPYWEYINLEALLSMQHTRTNKPDETIFIIYHQICELYFKLIIHEIEQFTNQNKKEFLDEHNWMKRIGRVINYFKKLESSFDVLSPLADVFKNMNEMDLEITELKSLKVNCFDTDEFKSFRLSLMPASGFQSFQMRKIEIMTTSLKNLLHPSKREKLKNTIDLKELYNNIYWKCGGRIVKDDETDFDCHNLKKTRTLEEFEKKYDSILLSSAYEFENKNVRFIYKELQFPDSISQDKLETVRSSQKIKQLLDIFNYYITQKWKLSHIDMVVKHLGGGEQNNNTERGTGGTYWKKYLDTKEQSLNFFE